MLSDTIRVPKSAIRVETMRNLPRTTRGKIDYQVLATWKERGRETMASQLTR
jgi:hypothetical protein